MQYISARYKEKPDELITQMNKQPTFQNTNLKLTTST